MNSTRKKSFNANYWIQLSFYSHMETHLLYTNKIELPKTVLIFLLKFL